MARTRIVLAGLSILAGCLAGCSEKSISSDTTSGSGQVSVYLADAPGDVASCNVRVSHLAIYSSSGQKVTLVGSGAVTQMLDLVAARATPMFVGEYRVPVGRYGAFECTLTGVNFSVMGTGATCTFSNVAITIPKTTLQGGMMQVGTVGMKLTVDVPIVSGSCPENGMMGTMSFGSMSGTGGSMM
jgi:hypothetical protein